MPLPFAVSTAALLVTLTATAPRADTTPQAVLDSIFASVARAGGPGCAAGVLRHGRIVASGDYGLARVATNARLGSRSVFPLQSIQKTFLALALLRLEQRGALALDDPVRKWMPELATLDTAVTIRRLVQHTSGLPDVGNITQFMGWPNERRVTRGQLIDIIARTPRLDYAPGTREAYSNAAQVLGPAIIERAARRPAAEALRDLVFAPTGMSRSAYGEPQTVSGPDVVASHGRSDDGTPREAPPAHEEVYATRDDLLAFARWWLAPPTAADSALVRRMRERALLPSFDRTQYGLGLERIEYRGVEAWYHGGDGHGGHSMLILWPGFDAAVVALCNGVDLDASSFAVGASDALFRNEWPGADSLERRARADAAREAREAAGLYFGEDGGPVVRQFRVSNDTLALVRGDDALPLARLAPGVFGREGSSVRWAVAGDTLWRVDGRAVWRHRRVSPEPTADLAPLVGCYRDRAYGITARIASDSGRLVVRWGDAPTPHRLEPRFTDGFSDGFAWLVFRRDARGRPVGASLHQERVWRVDLARLPACPPA